MDSYALTSPFSSWNRDECWLTLRNSDPSVYGATTSSLATRYPPAFMYIGEHSNPIFRYVHPDMCATILAPAYPESFPYPLNTTNASGVTVLNVGFRCPESSFSGITQTRPDTSFSLS